MCFTYVCSAFLVHNFVSDHKPADFKQPSFPDLWRTLVGAVVCFLARRLTTKLFYPTAYAISKVQDDKGLRAKYAHKACDNLYVTIYYIMSTYWGWSVLKETTFLPWYLGGPADGDFWTMTNNPLFTDYSTSLVDYSLFTFGYHVCELFEHVCVNERMNDFNEMLLHHVAAVALYFSATFANVVPYGCLIAYLHDLSDIPISLSKMLNSTRF